MLVGRPVKARVADRVRIRHHEVGAVEAGRVGLHRVQLPQPLDQRGLRPCVEGGERADDAGAHGGGREVQVGHAQHRRHDEREAQSGEVRGRRRSPRHDLRNTSVHVSSMGSVR